MNVKQVNIGAVKYKSIKAMVDAAIRRHEAQGKKAPSYMTVYMRMRKGMTAAQAVAKEPRKYTKKEHDLGQEVAEALAAV